MPFSQDLRNEKQGKARVEENGMISHHGDPVDHDPDTKRRLPFMMMLEQTKGRESHTGGVEFWERNYVPG